MSIRNVFILSLHHEYICVGRCGNQISIHCMCNHQCVYSVYVVCSWSLCSSTRVVNVLCNVVCARERLNPNSIELPKWCSFISRRLPLAVIDYEMALVPIGNNTAQGTL